MRCSPRPCRAEPAPERQERDLSPVNAAVETFLARTRNRWDRCPCARVQLKLVAVVRRPEMRNLVFVLIFALAVGVGRLTLHPGTQLSLIWPAAGVGFLWMLPLMARDGCWRRQDTWVALGLLTTVAGVSNLVTGMPVSRVVGFGVANAAQAVVTAWLYARGRTGQLALTSPPRLHRLLFAAAAGALAALPTGPWVQVLTTAASPSSLWQSVIRNVVSVFLVGLLGLLLATRFRTRLHRPSYAVRVVGIAITTAVMFWFLFLVPGALLLFVLIPLGMLVAYWTDPRTTAWHTVAVSVALIVATVLGHGPLNHADVRVEATLVQAVVLIVSVVSMTLVLDREGQHRLLAEIEASRLATLSQAQLMERLIYSIGEGVLLVGTEGDVIVSNPAARRLLGIREAATFGEIVRVPAFLYDNGEGPDAGDAGEAFHEITALEGYAPDAAAAEPFPGSPIVRALGGIFGPPTDVPIEDPDGGGPTVLSVTASPVETYEGTQAVVLVRDVTREREHLAELSRFAGVVAHDLLNPVTSIQAWSEVVTEELQASRQPGLLPMVGRITGSARRMQQLIDDLLDYSMSRGGDLTTARVDVGTLVNEIVQAGAYGADVDEPAGEVGIRVWAPHAVQADAGALRQVLTNLIGNAVKYSAPGAVPSVEIATEPASTHQVRLTVADRGIGIPPGHEREIFRELYRVPDHATAYRGTGLGLAICRRIVERHGGTIEARRRPGGGTVFELILPAAQSCCGDVATGCRCVPADAHERGIRVA